MSPGARDPDEADSADRRRDLGNRRWTGRSFASSRAPISPARLGVSTESLSETIRVATIGDVGPALAKFDAGDRLVPIRVQLDETARAATCQVIEQLRVPLGEHGAGGVPLVASSPTSSSTRGRPASIATTASARPPWRPISSAPRARTTPPRQINELPVMKSLPEGREGQPVGRRRKPQRNCREALPPPCTAGLMMVYAVLVLLFGTFLQPITILFSLPLSIGGAIIALLLTGKQLTMPVWIGILMLMGIVTKNAIMLVDFAVESIREGKPRDEAIIDAGMKRARPIVMTTIAMAAGMMPSALAFGAGGEFRSPMALAVIGGLVFSTVLSLVFVPAMFMMMDDHRRGVLALRQEAARLQTATTTCRRTDHRKSRPTTGSAATGIGARRRRRHDAPSRCAPPRSACSCSATRCGRAADPGCRPCATAAADG